MVGHLREFHAQVLRFRQAIEQESRGLVPSSVTRRLEDQRPQPGVPARTARQVGPERLTADRIRTELVALVEKQASLYSARGREYEQNRFKEIEYLMAALADEVFMQLAWPGKDAWNRDLLEEHFFQTHDAGQRFFTIVEELLADRDPERAEVAAACQFLLAVGFQGRFRDQKQEEHLEALQLDLFTFAHGQAPTLLEPGRKLFPTAYERTTSPASEQRLPRLRPWVLGVIGVVIGYLVLAQVLWFSGTYGLDTLLAQLASHLRTAP